MEYFESDLDKVNRYYRFTLVNIITVPTVFNISVENIPQVFAGIFLEANESGVWIMSMSESRKGKKYFHYHDKIIKIEEAGKINIDSLEDKYKEEIKRDIRKYEEKRKKEIELYNNDSSIPDVVDPNDTVSVNDMLSKVQEMIKENKKDDGNNFLHKRDKN
jgi:hypothetical protein